MLKVADPAEVSGSRTGRSGSGSGGITGGGTGGTTGGSGTGAGGLSLLEKILTSAQFQNRSGAFVPQ